MTRHERREEMKKRNAIQRGYYKVPSAKQLWEVNRSAYVYCGTSFVGQVLKNGHSYRGL